MSATGEQLELFAFDARVRREPVDPDGPVLQGPADITLTLPHPKLAWALARIEVHPHKDGRWMWSASVCGSGYKVGPKWGRFAPDQQAATRCAADEILAHIDRRTPDSMGISWSEWRQILRFARGAGA